MFFDYLVEIIIFCCIITFLYILYRNKTKHRRFTNETIASNTAKDLEKIKEILIDERSSCQEREGNLNQTICELQENLRRQTDIYFENKSEIQSEKNELQTSLNDLSERLENITTEKSTLLSQKKSSEIRLGHISETLAPFLDQFDFNPEECVFIGKPIDYISFGEDEITIIEVKSGNSQLNSNQRRIRDQVKSNSIVWKEVRIK
jgi:predicted Holliday junction resolvase-like endonuclease